MSRRTVYVKNVVPDVVPNAPMPAVWKARKGEYVARGYSHHEAGHALLCVMTGLVVTQIDMSMTPPWGSCHHDGPPKRSELGALYAEIAILLAGEEAYARSTRDLVGAMKSANHDRQQIASLLADAGLAGTPAGKALASKVVRDAKGIVDSVFNQCFGAVRELAVLLQKNGRVDGADVHFIVERHRLSAQFLETLEKLIA